MTETSDTRKSAHDDIEDSPAYKRARYDTTGSSPWILTKNDLKLHSIYDSGVGRLDSDSETDADPKAQHIMMYNLLNSTEKTEQIALLKASLPENTLNKLSLEEIENMFCGQKTGHTDNEFEINYFNRIPDEVVLTIFKKLTKAQLTNVALVCKRFRDLVEDESLWNHMDVSNRILAAGALGTILSRQVVVLRLSKTQIFSPPILPNSRVLDSDYRSRLMFLDLTMASVSPKTLEIMFNKCRRLKKLSLESVAVNDKVLAALSKNTGLEVINFAMSSGIKVGGLKHLLTSCRNIKELNLSWTYINSDSIDYICENLPTTLTRFNFSGCRKLLVDDNIEALVGSCPNLSELDLSDCTQITGEAVRNVAVLDSLNFLALSRCYNLPLSSLLYLKKLHSLQYLDVHGNYIDAEELEAIKEGLGAAVIVNKFKFSSVARPSVGPKSASIWNMRVRD